MLSTLDWLIDEVTKYPSRVKNAKKLKVTFLCVTRDIQMFLLFQEQFERYSSSAMRDESIIIELCLFCTKSASSAALDPPVSKKTGNKKVVPHPEIEEPSVITTTTQTLSFLSAITHNRPNFDEILLSKITGESPHGFDGVHVDKATAATARTGHDGRMAVLVCGPGPVVRSVQQACFQLQSQFGRESVALHQESFSL